MTAVTPDFLRAVRTDLVRMSRNVDAPHLASSLSVVEILSVLYASIVDLERIRRRAADRPRVLLSKGHAAMALYAVLAQVGLLPLEVLSSYGRSFSPLSIHPVGNALPGVEFSSGSLGHGLAVGAGMAWSGSRSNSSFPVFVVMGDGECQEGSVWEAAILASQWRLNNLVAVIDHNGLQSKGAVDTIASLADLRVKWEAFGWCCAEVDGHSVADLEAALRRSVDGPLVVIAHTVKGKGLPFMENDRKWHARGLVTDIEYELALRALHAAEA